MLTVVHKERPEVLKNRYKRFLFLLGDIVIVFVSYWVAAFLRYEGAIPVDAPPLIMLCTAISIFSAVILSFIFGCYNDLWQYAGFEVMFRQGIVAAISGAALLIVKYAFISAMSGSIAVIYGILLFVLTSGVRAIPRSTVWVKSLYMTKTDHIRRAVIVGAGDTGAMLVKRARDAQQGESFYPVALVDNDPEKIGLKLCGVKIAGSIDSIEQICKKYQAKEIIVALPNTTKEELYDIYRKCIKTSLPLKSSRNFADVKDSMQEDKVALKSVTIEDLLFRDVVENDMTIVKDFMKDRVVMVTGGAGSIGSELCRQALACGCGLLVIFDIDENGLYGIDDELKESFDKDRYALCLGSVRDIPRLNEAIAEYKPYVLFHAAAHKHVPMMELNPFEAIKNNVEGTMNVVDACIRNNVNKFILVSTDKAVNPVNIMGASKRIAELIVRDMSNRGTELAAVRFGNVLGSNGSVVPKFKRQIEAGGPVTLTHRDMVRYFMTISEAASLVLTAGTFAKNGEIFVLDMGRPVKIYDLAVDLIRLSGYEPDTEIKITETGLRPGERLSEELFLEGDKIDRTSHDKILILETKNIEDFRARCNEIIALSREGKDEESLRKAVFELVNGM